MASCGHREGRGGPFALGAGDREAVVKHAGAEVGPDGQEGSCHGPDMEMCQVPPSHQDDIIHRTEPLRIPREVSIIPGQDGGEKINEAGKRRGRPGTRPSQG